LPRSCGGRELGLLAKENRQMWQYEAIPWGPSSRPRNNALPGVQGLPALQFELTERVNDGWELAAQLPGAAVGNGGEDLVLIWRRPRA
jgi:hypothetical protein